MKSLIEIKVREKVAMLFCEGVINEKCLWNKLLKNAVLDAGYSKVWNEKVRRADVITA